VTERKNFADRLLEAVERKRSSAVVGIDPRLEWIPKGILDGAIRDRGPTLEGAALAIRKFCCEVVDLIEPYVAVVKPQIAFFEEYGPQGLLAYSQVVRRARERGLLVIGDAKRADIGSTSAAYARAHLGSVASGSIPELVPPLQVDALTTNPYFGSDGIAPFLETCRDEGRGIFILCRTSNPSAAELQDLVLEGGETVHAVVARSIASWGSDVVGDRGFSSVGAVVGLTSDHSTLGRIREILPRSIILVPGFGAQGGGADDLAPLLADGGAGVVVNSSRGVVFAYRKVDGGEDRWQEVVADAARDFRDQVNRARQTA
jgi:orotidine-5'-phosphate decarboxylase